MSNPEFGHGRSEPSNQQQFTDAESGRRPIPEWDWEGESSRRIRVLQELERMVVATLSGAEEDRRLPPIRWALFDLSNDGYNGEEMVQILDLNGDGERTEILGGSGYNAAGVPHITWAEYQALLAEFPLPRPRPVWVERFGDPQVQSVADLRTLEQCERYIRLTDPEVDEAEVWDLAFGLRRVAGRKRQLRSIREQIAEIAERQRARSPDHPRTDESDH